MTKRRMKYNPSFLTEEELIDSFVVRHADLDIIIGTIAENSTGSNQHILIVGPRGSGKTTMVHRVAAEIARTEELHAHWYPLIFSEESYEVVSAGEFWLEALFHLAEQTGEEKWQRTHRELKNETDDQRLAERALAQLLDFADSIGKRVVVMVENLNMLLGDMTSEDEAWKIRHTLINEPRLMLLATATCRFEHIENNSKAMFEMFKLQELKPLDDDECNLIWEHITGQKLQGERIKPIRILTGGNPRLLTIIAKFSAHRSFHKLLEDLVNLIDDHTEYFKSHLDSLPAIERKVYLALCSLWDASTAREIAREARIDINRTSSLLSRLVNRGAVTVEPNSKKTKWFVVAERMYNIYYLMRRRGKPSDRVKATVKFLTSMYDHESAAKLITEEACGLPPELRTNHCLAYEAAIAEIPDRELVQRIIAATPKEFLESPYLSEAVRSLAATNDNAPLGVTHYSLTSNESEKANELIIQGTELIGSGDYERAINIFDVVISMLDQPYVIGNELAVSMAMCNKGFALGMLNRCEEAIAAYDEVIDRFTDTSERELREQTTVALFNKGYHLDQLARSEEAIAAYDEVVDRLTNLPESELREMLAMALFNKGVVLGQLNRSSEEIAAYNGVITRFTDAHEISLREQVGRALINKGYRLYQLNQPEEAIAAFDEVITQFTDENGAVFREIVLRAFANKSLIYQELGDYGKTETTLRKASSYSPETTDYTIQLIELYLRLPNRLNDALLTMDEAIGNHPNNANLMNSIAWELYNGNHVALLANAEQLATKAVSLGSDNPHFNHTLACIQSALGKGQEALSHAERYLQDTDAVEKTIDDAIQLFVELAAAGEGREALALLEHAEAARHLEPLVVGLKIYLEEEVKTAPEIKEVGKDVAARIEERKRLRESAR